MTVNIGLERVDIQEGIIVEALLDSGTMRLVMSLQLQTTQGWTFLQDLHLSIALR